MTLAEVQCHLDRQGASTLVVELIIQNPNQNIFLMSVELGIALLEGGNTTIQNSMFNKLTTGHNSEKFFKIFHEKMVSAQHEIKSSVAVTTSELTSNVNKVNEDVVDGDMGHSGLKVTKSRLAIPTRSRGGGLALTDDLKRQVDDATSATSRAYAFVKSLGSAAMSSRSASATSGSPTTILTPPDDGLEMGDLASSSGALELTNDVIVKPDGTVITSKAMMPRTPGSPTSVTVSCDAEESKLPPEVAIMKPILRFLQLLCENHNTELQNFLRTQNNKNNYNMVSETLLFLDTICGSTTGGLGLLGLYINEKNVALVNQTIETLTEYCQGPCHDNQNCIAGHESNAIDIIIALILNDINPLGRSRMDLVLELKNNASKLLLAIMESRADSVNAERIMYNMSAKQLIEVACDAFHQSVCFEADGLESGLGGTVSNSVGGLEVLAGDQDTGDESDDEEVTPKEVGHNIYILCHQLAQHNKDLSTYLKPNSILEPGESSEANARYTKALSYYRRHTAQIEIVRNDRTLEQIVFPVPQICEYLTRESRSKVFFSAERDEQGSKVADFFNRTEDLFNEMRWQKKLRTQPLLYYVSSHMSTWGSFSFTLALTVNLIVAFCYPFDKMDRNLELETKWSLLLWLVTILSIISVTTFRVVRSWIGYRTLFVCSIVRMIFSLGIETTLWTLGLINVIVTTVHLISIMGNRGTFTKSLIQIIKDVEFSYHMTYLLVCIFGLTGHPFFYSVLLLSVVYQEETLRNVIRSVTRNGRSIILTALLAVILIYLFSIVGYLFFRDDFLMEVDVQRSSSGGVKVDDDLVAKLNETKLEDMYCLAKNGTSNCTVTDAAGKEKWTKSANVNSTANSTETEAVSSDLDDDIFDEEDDSEDKERACDSLLMCIITTLNQGLRNGGGIGDVLRPPSSKEPLFVARVVYDLLFFFVLIVIVLNLIFGVIIDTFADLRSEKQQKEEILKNTCFVCGLERAAFDNKSVSFEEHIRSEHNVSVLMVKALLYTN